MTRATVALLSIGTALFVALLAWQGFGAVAAVLMTAGWWIALVVAFHLVPLALDAFAILVMFDRDRAHAGSVSAARRCSHAGSANPSTASCRPGSSAVRW